MIMKRKLAFVLIIMMLTALFSTAGFAEQADVSSENGPIVYVKDGVVQGGEITAGNNVLTMNECDVVKFGFKDGFDPMINIRFATPADTAEYPILAFKVQRTGAGTEGQVFYNEPGQGATGSKVKDFTWGDTEEWQWIKIDYTGCGIIGYLRFDVFGSADVNTVGMIAAFAFFKTEEAADAFANSEAGTALGKDTGTHSIKEEIASDTNMRFYFYDKNGTISTGWWFHPYHEGLSLTASFESPFWFDRVWIYAYCSSNPCPILFTVLDENDNEVYSAEVEFIGNAEKIIELGKAIVPGYYSIVLESVERDEDADPVHFVLGSAPVNEDVEIDFSNNGAATNGDTQEAPAIQLLKCEADPDYTEKPTATPKPSAAPTDVPTPVPTQEAATDAPTDVPPETKTAENGEDKDGSDKTKGPNVGLITGIVAGVVVVACVVIAIIAAKKKKEAAKK